MRSIVAGVILIPLALCEVQAQTAPGPLTFDVASIKPSAPGTGGMFGPTISGGSFRIVGATLKNLITLAYGVRAFAISGGPAWAEADRFDVNARADVASPSDNSSADPKKTNAQLRERLKSLLAERFQLAVHRENKERNGYALVIARNGPKLSEAQATGGAMIRGKSGSIIGQGVSIQLLVVNLSGQLEAAVLDSTGLTGKYDFKLEWTPDTGVRAATATDPYSPSLFSALQEQLGLRLESRKIPVEMLVIDHAERPSAN